MAASLVAYGDSSESESESEEQVSQPVASKEDVRRLLSVLPQAGGGKAGKRQPVRIGLPTLDKGDDSDNDDDDLPAVKRAKKGAGRSGLTALLPEPKGSARELGAKKRPGMSAMVPYTLTKRRQDQLQEERRKQAKQKAIAKARGTASVKEGGGGGGEDSDSDDEPVSFFHLENSRKTEYESISARASSQSEAGSNAPVSVSSVPISVGPSTNTYADPHSIPEPETHSHEPPSTSHQSLGEATSHQPTAATPDSQHTHPQWNTGQFAGQCSESYGQYGGVNSAPGVSYDPSTFVQQGSIAGSSVESESVVEPPMPGHGPGLTIDNEVFRRLAGGKKRKHRGENLNNIIEISEGDVQESIKTYQKYNHEESVNKLYKPDMTKLRDPTSQQKRKHQLSYLAHEAKARELALKTQWAESAATKRQTQMKYGF